jgi:hypothetical protein
VICLTKRIVCAADAHWQWIFDRFRKASIARAIGGESGTNS